jgi:pimeloyl-ACP methyl ester carboxylesterase
VRYIYCHPLFDERKCAHRFSFQLKETFRADGLTLERFDYRGTGEAQGWFADVSVETLREDIARFVSGEQVCLVGLRFGASLAFDYCSRHLAPVRNLILVEPTIDGAEYVDYLYRKQRVKDLMTNESSFLLYDDGFKNIEGYKTSVSLIEQLRGFSLTAMAKEFSVENSVSIVQISSFSKLNPRIIALAKSLGDGNRRVFVENVTLPMFWERIPGTDYTELTQKILDRCHD